MDGLGGHALKDRKDRQRQILYNIRYVESNKYNKLVNITKKKQTHRYREQTSGYQWGEAGRGNIGVGVGLGGTNYWA